MAKKTDVSRNSDGGPSRASEDADDLQGFLDELQNGPELRAAHVDAREAASAVLCTLARRLSDGEDVKLLRALPEGIGELLGACEIHRGPSHARRMGRDEFIGDVADHLRIHVDQALRVVMAVFTAVRGRIDEDEVAAVDSQLPSDLKDLFGPPM